MQPFRNSKWSQPFCEDDRQINIRSPKRNQNFVMVLQISTCMQIFLPHRAASLSVLAENQDIFASQVALSVYEYSCEEGCC